MTRLPGRRPLLILPVVLALLMPWLTSSTALAGAADPGGSFTDDDGAVSEGAIEAIAFDGITLGCNPPGNYRYCPRDSVTRGQMAAFIARALGLPAPVDDHFIDDNSSVFENAINRLADAGITHGCNPPANTMFCPTRTMTRGEMAALMSRALDLPASSIDWFTDDTGHIFEGAINRVAEARITVGCNPPSNTNFCPNQTMNRGQMAIFLTRALDLMPLRPPAPTKVPVLFIGDGDIIHVQLGGVSEPLKLIGIEAAEDGQRCSSEATAAIASLVEGETVRIDMDVSNRDAFGRLLRYVFLADGTFVNAELVEAGWAAATDFPPDSRFAELLATLEDEAQSAGRGRWANNCVGDENDDVDGPCHPAYPDFCIPEPPPDLDCTDLGRSNFNALPPDPHGFDGSDNDFVGCDGG